MKSFLRKHWPSIGWAIIIFTVSSIPRLQVPELGISLADKWAHLLEYGIFGYLLLRSCRIGKRAKGRPALLAAVIGISFGAIDELHQALIPGRFSSLIDFAADTLGILAGILIFHLVSRYLADVSIHQSS